MSAPLDGYRVVDITTARGEMAGRVLTDLGAEVIKVEPPGGVGTRLLPPFINGHEGESDGSLFWAAVGLGKKSVVLDLEDAEGRERFKELVASADVLFESHAPGTMSRLGLGYDVMAELNPRLVYCSITPFGQDGPEAESPATDLTIECAGGLVGLQGDGDRPPIPIGFPQASFHGAVQAAADAVVALHERLRSGRGQYLDTSTQAAVVWTLMNATGYPPNIHGNPPGYAEARALPPPQVLPGLRLPRLMECADGHVTYTIVLPAIGPRTHDTAMKWAEREGAVPAEIAGIDWMNWIAEAAGGTRPVADVMASLEALAAFFRTKTKRQLQEFAAATGILLCPVFTIADLLDDPHLQAREYWTRVAGRVHPGPFAKLSKTPLAALPPAPALGADQALLDDCAPKSLPTAGSGGRRQSFDGLKVADFAWVGVGPIIAKALADHGATVVHVESQTRPDVLRLLPPFKDGTPGINRAQFMANFNTSKAGVACNLSTAEGRELALKLIDWADVVVESFTPGTMAKLGLDYASIVKRRPDIVMLSTCLRGQTGPERTYSGFGGQGAQLAGIFSVTGWPDRPPTGPWGAYTDFINPRFGVAALTAALIHKAKTGEGQYIDQAQGEAGIRFIEPLVLDYTVNGRTAAAMGHDSPFAAPHGVYACAGTERYLGIAVETGEQWEALKRVAPLQAFAGPAYATVPQRRAAREVIDEALRGWCREQDAFALGERLRRAGVPAYPVLYPVDLYTDAQLAHREFFVTLDHAEMGPTPYDGLVTTFSATPGRLRNAAPCLGQDTDYVLREVLGLSDEEMVELAMAGALS
ncbi:MAG: CaiB/BaiF CoA transferase family protein [Dehalococcoidia bacterium]